MSTLALGVVPTPIDGSGENESEEDQRLPLSVRTMLCDDCVVPLVMLAEFSPAERVMVTSAL